MTRRLILFLLACCMGSFAAASAHAAPPTPVDVSIVSDRVPIWESMRVVVPDDPDATPEQAAELAAADGAIAVDNPNRVLGRGMRPYWALFSLQNVESVVHLRLLALEATTQFDVRLFERDAKGAWRQVTSVADAGADRFSGGTTHPVWALRLAPRGVTDLLLRVEGPAVVRFPVFVYHPLGYAENERKIHIALGVALGSCLFIIVYIGSLRRYFDDKSVPLFIAMLVADLAAALWLSGFMDELLPAVPKNILATIGLSAYATLFGCGSLHARIYLNTAAWAPRADRLLQVLGWLWLILVPWFSIGFPVASRILAVWGGTLIAVILVIVSGLAARRRIPFSEFIAAAWLSYLLIGGSFLLARAVDNPALWSSSSLSLVQATVVAILFGFAMSQRLIQQREKLVAARQEAIMQNEKAAALMRERSLLFAATNHDLRQPLIGISLFVDLLKAARTHAEREAHARKLDMALKEVDGLLVGIQQLAAVHESSHRPPMETVKLDDLLAPVIEEYRGRSGYKRITIRYVPSKVSITTHVPYFQRIVRNVLSNAIRYTEQGDRILVGCRRDGGLRLVIADTGRGMTEEQTRQAFDAFQRFDAKGTIPDGFGLGLFSTKSLATALGMTVRLQSHKGRGTEFSMSLR